MSCRTRARPQIGGPADEMVYAGATGVFQVPQTGPAGVYAYGGTPYQWTQIGGPGDMVASSATELYGLGPGGGYVAEWSGSGPAWTRIGGPAWAIAAGS